MTDDRYDELLGATLKELFPEPQHVSLRARPAVAPRRGLPVAAAGFGAVVVAAVAVAVYALTRSPSHPVAAPPVATGTPTGATSTPASTPPVSSAAPASSTAHVSDVPGWVRATPPAAWVAKCLGEKSLQPAPAYVGLTRDQASALAAQQGDTLWLAALDGACVNAAHLLPRRPSVALVYDTGREPYHSGVIEFHPGLIPADARVVGAERF